MRGPACARSRLTSTDGPRKNHEQTKRDSAERTIRVRCSALRHLVAFHYLAWNLTHKSCTGADSGREPTLQSTLQSTPPGPVIAHRPLLLGKPRCQERGRWRSLVRTRMREE